MSRTRTRNPQAENSLAGAVARAIGKTQDYLLGIQNSEGYWKGDLEGDASVSAGYIPIMHYFGLPVSPERMDRIVRTLRAKQNADGSWSAYHGGPGDISVTAQVYFALKLAGVPRDDDCLQRACRFTLSRGGLMKINMITRIWLALFGQFDWKGIPTMPPEVIFCPFWFYFNIYECSSWARATMMALTILTVKRPVCHIPATADISELYAEPEAQRIYTIGTSPSRLSWEHFFLTADKLLKHYEKMSHKPLRNRALKKATTWIIKRQEWDGSWGGIMLPWVYSLFALKCMGYERDHSVVKKGLEGLEKFIVEKTDSFLLEPATSPVWDTAWSVLALRESGISKENPALRNAVKWLISKEIRQPGDWIVKNPSVRPGGWSFEFHNRWYPDIDDTSVVPRALMAVKLATPEEESVKTEAIERAVEWAVEMQGDNGGWAAFDRNNNRAMLSHVPFSDFMTPLDPVSPDVTNHVIELLAKFDGVYEKEIEHGIDYLKKSQEQDGTWYGRWGVNYLYGTGLVIPSLCAAGEHFNRDYIQKAAKWLLNRQNPDGGWGESCQTYDDPALRGKGESTASQTAWALMGLMAAGKTRSEAVKRGITYLLDTQQKDGSWQEDAFTGTGFPRAFYLRYDLYRVYFPLMALARYQTLYEEAAAG